LEGNISAPHQFPGCVQNANECKQKWFGYTAVQQVLAARAAARRSRRRRPQELFIATHPGRSGGPALQGRNLERSRAFVEQIVAVTANASIGYAAYYAATREFPDRHITLRHKNSVVARWSGPKH